MTEMKKRGKLIVIEGSDGAGKKTQTKLLVERAIKKGYGVKTMSFPQYDKPTGKRIEDYLKGKFGDPVVVDPVFASKLYAEDRLEAKSQIMGWINSDINIILDRWIESNLGYQVAKVGEENKIKLVEWIKRFEMEQNGLPGSDLVIYLNLPIEINQEAMEKEGRIKDGHEKNIDYLSKVEKVYLWLASKNENWKIIDCLKESNQGKIRKTIEEINDEIWGIVEPILTK